MISNFILSALLLAAGLVIGATWAEGDRPADRIFSSIWLGLLLLGNLFLTLSFFAPLARPLAPLAGGLLAGLSLCSKKNRTFLKEAALLAQPAPLLGALIVLAAAAAYGSQIIVWYDSGFYHIPAIQWLSRHGWVPGLALIHERIGYPSSWLALAAPFNTGILQDRVFSFPGGLCLALLLLETALAAIRILENRARADDRFLAICAPPALFIALALGMPNSPSPDFPVLALILLTCRALLAAAPAEKLGPLLLAAGATTIKLHAAPLMLVAGLYYLFNGGVDLKKLGIAGLVALLSLAPTAAGGVLASGCAFYPAALFCVDLPWSIGKGAAAAVAQETQDWSRWGGPAPDGAGPINWIVPWIIDEKIAALLILLSLISAAYLIRSGRKKTGAERAVAAAALLGAGLVLCAAPLLRQALGYLLILPALAAGDWLARRRPRSAGLFLPLCALLSLFLAAHSHVLRRRSYPMLDAAFAAGTLAPGDRPHFNLWRAPKTLIPKLRRRRDVDFDYDLVEDGDQCWDAPPPCAAKTLEGVRLRDPRRGLAGGFKRF